MASGWRSALVAALLVAAVALIDLGPFRVYRYLLISDVLLLATLAVQIGQRWNGKVYVPKFASVLFGLYLLSSGVAFSRPVHPEIGLFTWLHSVFLMCVYVPATTTLFVLRPDLRKYVIAALVVSVTVQAWLITERVATGENWREGSRIAGAFGSVQVWPYVAAVTAAVGWLMTGTPAVRAAAFLVLAVIAPAEMFMRARALWLASLVGAGLFALLQARHKARAVATVVAVCSLLTGTYLLELFPFAIQLRIADVVAPSQANDLVARQQVFLDMGHAVLESRLLGLGIGQSPDYLNALPIAPAIVNAHNVVLHAAAEGGIVAAFAFALLPLGILLLRRSALLRPLSDQDLLHVNWATAVLVAVFVAAQLTPTLYEHTFFFLLGFLASLAVPEGAVPAKPRGEAVPWHTRR